MIAAGNTLDVVRAVMQRFADAQFATPLWSRWAEDLSEMGSKGVSGERIWSTLREHESQHSHLKEAEP